MFSRHEIVACDEHREPFAQVRFVLHTHTHTRVVSARAHVHCTHYLERIEDSAMMEVGVRKDAIHATTNTANLRYRRLFDCDARWEVFVAVQQRRGTVERVSSVVNSTALLSTTMIA